MSLTAFLTNTSEVIASTTLWTTNIMDIFMQPPLVVFVGIGIFGTVVYLVKGLIR